LNRKRTVIIAISIAGAVGLIIAAAIIISALRANQPEPDPISPTTPSYSSEATEPEAYTEAPTDPVTLPPATEARSTQPPANPAPVTPAPVAPANKTLPSDAEVMALFKATRFSKMAPDGQLNPDEWLVYLPVNTTITIPAGWIANTDPARWGISGAPAGYKGNRGETLTAGTTLTALENNNELYVRFLR